MEVAKQIQDLKAKFIITVPELWDTVKDLGFPAIVIRDDGDGKWASSPIISLFRLCNYFSRIHHWLQLDF